MKKSILFLSLVAFSCATPSAPSNETVDSITIDTTIIADTVVTADTIIADTNEIVVQ